MVGEQLSKRQYYVRNSHTLSRLDYGRMCLSGLVLDITYEEATPRSAGPGQRG